MLSTSQGRACITELRATDLNFNHDNYREQKARQNHNIKQIINTLKMWQISSV
jgi:hypothetical protein